jgi:hypothetical protein
MGLDKIPPKWTVSHFARKRIPIEVRRTSLVSNKSRWLFPSLKKPPFIVDMPLSSPDGYLDFTNAVPRAVKMVATSNVGIGTSSPQYALDVHGTSNTGPLTVSSLTIADGEIVGDVSISGNLAFTSNTTTSVDSNVVVEHKGPHSRDPKAVPLKKYPEIVFDDTSKMDMGEGGTNGLLFKQAGYTITASSTHPTNDRGPYRAFNGDHTTGWICASSSWNFTTNAYQGGRGIGGYSGEWIKLELPQKIKVKTMYIEADLNSGRRPLTGKLLGSDDDSIWVIIKDMTNIPNQDRNTLDISSTVAYKYIAFLTETIPSGNDTVWIDEIEYYGYEEDPPTGDTSVDTTFTSIMNTPQTTGANVYVDGSLGETLTNRVTGPTPTGTSATYDSTGKYWELNGTLTSNIAVEANTFLEGDQPHSVSVWFNSSNLEANVSNTCVFSVSDQEKLDSQNLDLQSNTWHNLTYAYQGEGGSRVTYLDGRKVAEDQAEDTFGDYPPFAMTGYSQGGYVVSASSEGLSPDFLAWYAFDALGTNNNSWTPGSTYSSGTPATYPGPERLPGVDTSGATIPLGEWLKLQLPYKLVLSSLRFNSRSTTQSPKDFKIYGSNDDYNWDLLLTGVGTGANPNANLSDTVRGDEFAVNATKGYKYLAMSVQTVIGNAYVHIADLKYYGHRENDLVRLPDPANVLKYPHIAMTGPAQRGYVVSASDITSDAPEWYAFDGVSSTRWRGSGGQYTNGDANSTVQLSSSSSTPNGSWIKVEFPHKLKINKMRISGATTQSPKDGELWASNNDSDWTQIFTFSNMANGSAGNFTDFNFTPLSSDYFKYFALIVTKTGATNETLTSIYELEYYGTGVDSIPIQIGGGNIDKVANFRVYDKFVGEDQALEIWDAQKDVFREVKNSMTLHKGRLGIGTTEPEGRLAVLDEPHNLEEFPPRAMTAEETYMEGHGVFKVSASSVIATNYEGWRVFDEYTNSNGTNDPSGRWTAANNTSTIGSLTGKWVKLELPYRVNFSKIGIFPPSYSGGSAQCPTGFSIIVSNDDETWTTIKTLSNYTWTEFAYNYITFENDGYFKYIAVVATTNGGNPNTSFQELKYFGTREQGQSVLHDGQLTLTKNLNVPRIGPALDADDTPRRDRLVVEYNTSTNPTFEGAVRDTSGRGNDGMFNGTASYDAMEKSLTSSGTTGEIRIGNLPTTTITQLSLSFWINPSGNAPIFYHGYEDLGRRISFSVDTGGTGLFFAISSNYIRNTACLTVGRWQHVSVVFLGGSIGTSLSDGSAVYKLYIDGADKGWNGGLFNAGTLQLENGHPLVLMNGKDGTSGTGAIKLSNFKYHDVALTAQEVKTLYDMGRCDEGHHVVNFSKTRVGIGLGDGEAPTYTLDVRGQIRSQGSLVTSFTGQHRCVPDEPMEKGLIVSAKKNKFVKLNGGLDTGKGAITIDESLPVVSLSSVANDKSCFGVVSSMEEANTTSRTETTDGGVISIISKTLGDNRAIVNSVGEGAIWVVDTNGPLESGDYITTSNVAGYGQKQEDDVLHNYTVAKITMDCDFTGTEVPVQVIKREEIGRHIITEDVWNTLVDYDRSSTTETQYSHTLEPEAYSDQSGYVPREVTTIVDYTDGSNTISIEEWSNLESNIQNTYQSNTFTEIVDYTKFVTAEEWSNLTIDVQNTYSEAEITTYYQIKRGENVLDENGQLQWEDKTGATEAPYERRFLDASGAQTDEANAVHIAAFVGCTYHCG